MQSRFGELSRWIHLALLLECLAIAAFLARSLAAGVPLIPGRGRLARSAALQHCKKNFATLGPVRLLGFPGGPTPSPRFETRRRHPGQPWK
jgi:hypothetical protein